MDGKEDVKKGRERTRSRERKTRKEGGGGR